MPNDNGLQPDRSDIERVQRLVGTHYRLNWIVGRGGMSTVWLANDVETGEPVAIKVLKPEYTDNSEFRERFRNEATAASLIDSPHVVHTYAYREVLDAGMTFCFIIMEFVRGESLADVLVREKKLPEPLALDVLQQGALGLQAIHAAGMVHRDIKPGNLLITPDGTVKVADFGIAKAAAAVPLTRTGMVVGTAQYVSPEQAQGFKVTPASDIYSLGVVGYEMLTGERPFKGDSTVSVAIAHINSMPPALPETITRATRELIATSLRKDPLARYANGAELTVAVAHVRAGEMPPLPETLHEQISPDGTVDPKSAESLNPNAPTTMFTTSGAIPTTQFVSPAAPTESIAQVANVRPTPGPNVQGPATKGGSPASASVGGAATNRPNAAGDNVPAGASGGRHGRPEATAGSGQAKKAGAAGAAGASRSAGSAGSRSKQKDDKNANRATTWLWTLIGLLVLVILVVGGWLAFGGIQRDGDRDRTGQVVTSVVTSVVPGEETTQQQAPTTTRRTTRTTVAPQPTDGEPTDQQPANTSPVQPGGDQYTPTGTPGTGGNGSNGGNSGNGNGTPGTGGNGNTTGTNGGGTGTGGAGGGGGTVNDNSAANTNGTNGLPGLHPNSNSNRSESDLNPSGL